MSTLIRPRNGSSSLGARSTKQALQSWATLSSRMLKALVLKTKIDFFPTQSYRLLTTQIISIWTVYTVDFFFQSTNRNTGLKKKKKWVEACLCPARLAREPCPSLSPVSALLALGGPYLSSVAAVSIPLSVRWDLSVLKIWSCWSGLKVRNCWTSLLGFGPLQEDEQTTLSKAGAKHFKGLIILVAVPFLDPLLIEGRRGPQRIHN